MRPQKVIDTEVLKGLMSVLRAKGYDGASLNELAEAAGLKKASLYHRFPGGKKEMVTAVMDFVQQWTHEHIFQVLADENVSPKIRLSNALNNIRALYNNGDEICVLRALSMETGLILFGEQIQQGINKWIAAFETIGLAFGFEQSTASEMAEDTFIQIQGSLMVAKGTGSLEVFEKNLTKISKKYVPT